MLNYGTLRIPVCVLFLSIHCIYNSNCLSFSLSLSISHYLFLFLFKVEPPLAPAHSTFRIMCRMRTTVAVATEDSGFDYVSCSGGLRAIHRKVYIVLYSIYIYTHYYTVTLSHDLPTPSNSVERKTHMESLHSGITYFGND